MFWVYLSIYTVKAAFPKTLMDNLLERIDTINLLLECACKETLEV